MMPYNFYSFIFLLNIRQFAQNSGDVNRDFSTKNPLFRYFLRLSRFKFSHTVALPLFFFSQIPLRTTRTPCRSSPRQTQTNFFQKNSRTLFSKLGHSLTKNSGISFSFSINLSLQTKKTPLLLLTAVTPRLPCPQRVCLAHSENISTVAGLFLSIL